MTSRRAAFWALGVIFTANFLNYLDRQLVSALEKPLADSFGLSHLEFGFLWTLFTIGYMVCAVPVGLLADRFNRPRLFAFCVVVWSIATIASGLAQTKWILYGARVFIGVGEAGCLVIGPAIISDLFSREHRSRALSIFFLGMPLGGTAAFLLTGAALKFDVDWRDMFFIAGAPGFIIAVLIWMLADPPRGMSEGGHHGMQGGGSKELADSPTGEGAHHGMQGGGIKEYVLLLKTRTLLFIIMAQAFAVIVLIPLVHFGTKFFEDARGMKADQARLFLGLMALIGGVCGNLVSGILGDRLFKRTKAGYSILAGCSYLLGWPCLLLGFLAPSPWIFLPALTLGSFFLFLCMPAVNTQIANVVSPKQRATAWSLAVLILHLLGDMSAPPIFGEVNEMIGMHKAAPIGAFSGSLPLKEISDKLGRQEAFLIFSVGLLLAGACSLLAALTATRDTERVAEQIAKQQDAAGANPDVH